jgi:hypothetical protein
LEQEAAMSAREIYEKSIRQLSPIERLRLASLILDDLAASAEARDVSDEWTDADLADLSAFASRLTDASEKES